MLATFAFDVCHDVYLAAREAIDTKIPTLNAEVCGKYQWRPDRMPRLAEYVCDFALAGERALGMDCGAAKGKGWQAGVKGGRMRGKGWLAETKGERTKVKGGYTDVGGGLGEVKGRQAEARPTVGLRASRMAMFRVYYLGGAEYQAARRHLGISEFTWADWSEEIRRVVGSELARAGVFPPSKYFREFAAKAS